MAALASFSRLLTVAANSCVKRTGPVLLSNKTTPVVRFWETSIAGVRTRPHWMLPKRQVIPDYQQDVYDTSEEDEKITKAVIEKVNDKIATNSTGRLFAVVHICGKQFKVTNNDIIVIEGSWPPTIGDKLVLEKVLLVGGADFTLVGRPILNREDVYIDATVIEKTLSHTKTFFRKKKRKQYMRINFYRVQHTMLRINSINIGGKINETKEVEGLDRIF